MGGFGGPGAMKATVEAVALLATTGSRTRSSTREMFRKSRTVHTPCKKHKWLQINQSFFVVAKDQDISERNRGVTPKNNS